MKKVLLASALAIASFPGYARAQTAADECVGAPDEQKCLKYAVRKDCEADVVDAEDTPAERSAAIEDCVKKRTPKPLARVTVAPPYQGPPPIGWIYAPYAECMDPPRCSMVAVNVQADGLNVRATPNGPPVMALVNGTPLIPVGRMEGKWVLVAPACDLTPTWAWSWTAGVPLNRCWVYF